jgi:hypothetical protein
MPAPDAVVTGDELLTAVTEAMVAFHQRYYHRKPITGKTLMLGDDLLACVLGGVFISAVERLSGRRVLAFISNNHVGPDIEIVLFLLTPYGTTELNVD